MDNRTKRLTVSDDRWDSQRRWREQIEIKLQKYGSMTEGNQKFAAERTADLLEQIDELRQTLKELSERHDKLIERLKEKFNANT